MIGCTYNWCENNINYTKYKYNLYLPSAVFSNARSMCMTKIASNQFSNKLYFSAGFYQLEFSPRDELAAKIGSRRRTACSFLPAVDTPRVSLLTEYNLARQMYALYHLHVSYLLLMNALCALVTSWLQRYPEAMNHYPLDIQLLILSN